MKERIRTLLKMATPGGYNPQREESGSQWQSPGDTYERYAERCRRMDVIPQPFSEWLAFELNVAEPERRRGGTRPPKLDQHSRQFQAG